GKGILETLLQRVLEPAFARFIAVALGFLLLLLELVLNDALFGNRHACSPQSAARFAPRVNNAWRGSGVPGPVISAIGLWARHVPSPRLRAVVCTHLDCFQGRGLIP